MPRARLIGGTPNIEFANRDARGLLATTILQSIARMSPVRVIGGPPNNESENGRAGYVARTTPARHRPGILNDRGVGQTEGVVEGHCAMGSHPSNPPAIK